MVGIDQLAAISRIPPSIHDRCRLPHGICEATTAIHAAMPTSSSFTVSHWILSLRASMRLR